MLFLFSCNNLEEGNEGEEVLALEEIVQVAQQRSINRHSIDWDALQTEILEVRNSDGFDEAISVFLRALGDNQSFYSRLNGRNIFATEANCSGSGYDFGGLADNIGYIQMRAFLGNNTQATLFAGDRHNRAKTQDGPDTRGWVIDLTTTNGGSIYPVIASLGPFYHQEVLGYFIDADENQIPWGYADDGAFIRTTAEKQTVVSDPYTLMDSDAKLVVVIDLATAGAGEAALIALKNRPNTLVLGRPTCGLAAVTESFTLSNSDILVLATNYIADSDKQVYPGRLMPDEQIGNTDDLLARIHDFIGN
jgi:C-terminal processing protease CtpA/Prc